MIYWPFDTLSCGLPLNTGYATADTVQPPTAQAFLTRYPTFAKLDQSLVTAVLAEAANEVDSSWRLTDQSPAIMAYAAHLITLEGLTNGSSDIPGISANISGPLTSYQAGDTKISFASSVASASVVDSADGDLVRTVYGLRFIELRDRNRVPAALIV